MPMFRTDRYIKIAVDGFLLEKSSETLFKILQNVSDLRNVQMTRVRVDKETQGKIRIEEWYEITGALNVPEGGKSFWVISKPRTPSEPFNFFMRVDRNSEAEDYETAQQITSDWVYQSIMKPLEAAFSIQEKSINLPEKISQVVMKLGESK